MERDRHSGDPSMSNLSIYDLRNVNLDARLRYMTFDARPSTGWLLRVQSQDLLCVAVYAQTSCILIINIIPVYL